MASFFYLTNRAIQDKLSYLLGHMYPVEESSCNLQCPGKAWMSCVWNAVNLSEQLYLDFFVIWDYCSPVTVVVWNTPMVVGPVIVTRFRPCALASMNAYDAALDGTIPRQPSSVLKIRVLLWHCHQLLTSKEQ